MTSYEYGRKAYREGIRRCIDDREFQKTLDKNDDYARSISAVLIRNWVRGWHDAKKDDK